MKNNEKRAEKQGEFNPMVRPPFNCRLGLHKYGKWGEKYTNPNAAFHFEFQQRTCLGCGQIDERTI